MKKKVRPSPYALCTWRLAFPPTRSSRRRTLEWVASFRTRSHVALGASCSGDRFVTRLYRGKEHNLRESIRG